VSISVDVYFLLILECELGRAQKGIRHYEIMQG
jgi:hypothetical protein